MRQIREEVKEGIDQAANQPKGESGIGRRILNSIPGPWRQPSPEQQAKIERIRREGEAEVARIQKEGEVGRERIQRGIDVMNADTERRRQELQEYWATRPERLDFAIDFEAQRTALEAGGNSREIISQNTIYRWNDGHGNIIYLPSNISNPDQIHDISARIQAQKQKLEGLSAEEQDAARNDPAKKELYADYLQSEALRSRFEQLKQGTAQ